MPAITCSNMMTNRALLIFFILGLLARIDGFATAGNASTTIANDDKQPGQKPYYLPLAISNTTTTADQRCPLKFLANVDNNESQYSHQVQTMASTNECDHGSTPHVIMLSSRTSRVSHAGDSNRYKRCGCSFTVGAPCCCYGVPKTLFPMTTTQAPRPAAPAAADQAVPEVEPEVEPVVEPRQSLASSRIRASAQKANWLKAAKSVLSMSSFLSNLHADKLSAGGRSQRKHSSPGNHRRGQRRQEVDGTDTIRDDEDAHSNERSSRARKGSSRRRRPSADDGSKRRQETDNKEEEDEDNEDEEDHQVDKKTSSVKDDEAHETDDREGDEDEDEPESHIRNEEKSSSNRRARMRGRKASRRGRGRRGRRRHGDRAGKHQRRRGQDKD